MICYRGAALFGVTCFKQLGVAAAKSGENEAMLDRSKEKEQPDVLKVLNV